MYYLRCTISNFIYNGRSFANKYDIIFGKLYDDELKAFTDEELKSFSEVVSLNQWNFEDVELVVSEYWIDLYDKIRDCNSLPERIIFKPDNIQLLNKGAAIDIFPDFTFIPLGVFNF